MFVWILSHVPSAIALSLFILKSSNLDKTNDASHPDLSCGNREIINCLQFETRPCPLRNFRVAKRTSFLSHYALPLYPHAVFCLESFANETQLSYTKDADIIGLPLVHLIRKANSPRRLDYFGIPRTIATTSLSFERLLHLDYLTLVFVAEVTSLGGEVVSWW